MGDAPGQLTDRLELLSLTQSGLGLLMSALVLRLRLDTVARYIAALPTRQRAASPGSSRPGELRGGGLVDLVDEVDL